MKFYAYCQDKTLKDCNGGSLVLFHHLHALAEIGQENGGLLNLDEKIPEDADFIMFQSEWYVIVRKYLQNSKAKRICWLGHFKPHSNYGMPSISSIDADYFHTQWKGDCVDWAKTQIKKPIHYLPHGGCLTCFGEEGKKIDCPSVLFIGNHYPERNENWLQYADVNLVQSPFEAIKDYYYSAIVCPNISGDFQKNRTCDFFQIPGEMINERIFQIILSGGFAISDDTAIVGEFFNQSEVIRSTTKEEFKKTIDFFVNNPNERRTYMKKAKKRIKSNYLYKHYWDNFLKEII